MSLFFNSKLNSICQLVKAPNALQKAYVEWNNFDDQFITKEKGCFDDFSIWEQILELKKKIHDSQKEFSMTAKHFFP